MGKGLLYQLKSCFRDKMCVLSFLLPVAAGIALHFLGEVDLLELAEPEFGVVKESLSAVDIQSWLEEMGTVRVYPSEEALEEAVLEPSTNIMGILPREDGISVIRAGDEQELYRRLADRLPLLYEERAATKTVQVTLDVREADTGMKKLLLSISIVTAMFMGGTFSAMNILGEKEDGILLVNDILPCSRLAYLFQKIGVGLLGGVLSAGLTTVICIWPVRLSRLPGLAAVIFLSAFLASLAGAFIGRAAEGLMTGIGLLKLVMIGFIAPPILFWLLDAPGGGRIGLTCLIPSVPAFQGIMELLEGGVFPGEYILLLAIHCGVWLALYLRTDGNRERRKGAAGRRRRGCVQTRSDPYE